MATGLGVLPSAIEEEPAVYIFELLRYWSEEPPAHVTLALRYLGPRKKQGISEQEAKQQIYGLCDVMQKGAAPLPQELRGMAEWAQEQEAKLRAAQKRK